MRRPKVLYVCHTHPALFPGGAQTYALELYEAMRAYGDFEPIFLARLGSNLPVQRHRHPGTPLSSVNGDPNQYFFWTSAEGADFDHFYGTSRNKDICSVHFDGFLREHRPDIVHFQHTSHLGFDFVRQARNSLPGAPIVYTLHEYLPICNRDGQMVRTLNQELCRESSPGRCHECFPQYSPQMFFLRKRFIQSQLSLVDQFVAPSNFLLERYVDWGIPREKIQFEEYGRSPALPIPFSGPSRPRNRIGFFGQFNPYKGVDVLLRAMAMLGRAPQGPEEGRAVLRVHGANLDFQTDQFRDRVRALLQEASQNTVFLGSYDREELPLLMASIDWVVVPSIWWENSPLVIQEAFLHGRPVICSDIGGMAEKVTHGVNGLHFRAGDALSLAETIDRAVRTPHLWETLRKGIPPLSGMEAHVAALGEIYEGLLLARRREAEVMQSGR